MHDLSITLKSYKHDLSWNATPEPQLLEHWLHGDHSPQSGLLVDRLSRDVGNPCKIKEMRNKMKITCTEERSYFITIMMDTISDMKQRNNILQELKEIYK